MEEIIVRNIRIEQIISIVDVEIEGEKRNSIRDESLTEAKIF